jgi:hypothetical protein
MKEKKPRVNKKRIAKAMKPLNALEFPSDITYLSGSSPTIKQSFTTPEDHCSIWLFIIPSLLILAIPVYYYYNTWESNIDDCPNYITQYEAQYYAARNKELFHTSGIENTALGSEAHGCIAYDANPQIEQISSDLESGHSAKADRELHQLKLSLEEP